MTECTEYAKARRLAPCTAGECQHGLHSHEFLVIGFIQKTRNFKIHTQFVHGPIPCIVSACTESATASAILGWSTFAGGGIQTGAAVRKRDERSGEAAGAAPNGRASMACIHKRFA
jgi:hypothetical protein